MKAEPRPPSGPLALPADANAGSTAPAFPPPPPPLPSALTAPKNQIPDATPTLPGDAQTALAASGPRPLSPVPEPPDAGVIADARYVISLMRARWERRAAIRDVDVEIKKDIATLDGILGDLGRAARAHKITVRPLTEESQLIDAAEARGDHAERAIADARTRLDEEDARFALTSKELAAKLASAEEAAAQAGAEHARLEEERRTLRERRKQLEARQKQYLKSADDREAKAGKLPMGDERSGIRRSAEDLRSEAARLEPERSDVEKRLGELEQPLSQAAAQSETARLDLEATRKAQGDAVAGHRHRRAELEAEGAKQTRARAEAQNEIGRRLVTLGTLLNLNRVALPDLDVLYARVDGLRTSIANREREIDRLRAEASRSDPRAVSRGTLVLIGAVVLAIALICILIAIA